MSKIIVLGDIHGRTIWQDILEKENPSFENDDKVIFLGDYVSTHDNISSRDQIANLENILALKEAGEENVILLRGNHDTQHLGYYWAECSGRFRDVEHYLIEHKDEFLEATQWIYIYNNFLFSHAGISKNWLQNTGVSLNEINNLPPSELFGFTPSDYLDMYGTSPCQPCTWIRPMTLDEYGIDNYIQIVGHTPVKNIIKTSNKGIWLCDCLGNNQYLTITDNELKVNIYDE